MLRQGPLSPFVHGVLEYAIAVLFIVAPFLFGFDERAPTAIAIVVGVALLVFTASSELPTGLARSVPVGIHAVVDVLLAVFLIAAPFLFSFNDEGAATAFFIVLGVGFLLLTIATRFLPERAAV
jgi:hypothetical protein